MLVRRAAAILILLLTAGGLIADDIPSADLDQLAAVTNPDERRAAFLKKLSAIETLNAQLVWLEDAESREPLKEYALSARVDLLLLSGRTEEAESLLDTTASGRSDLKNRLEITHGRKPLPASPRPGTVAGVDRETIQERAAESPQSPEYYASRRGMIISAGVLFSPYEGQSGVEQTALPQAANENETDAETVSIQVGAFSSEENARAHLEFLSDRGVSARIVPPSASDGRKVYKTVVSGIPSDDAQQELIRLKEKGIEGFILY